MRTVLHKRTSTKAERIFAELLKKHRIPFLHRQRLEGKEIDFIIRNYAIEIDGHAQSAHRNHWLVNRGLVPIHFANRYIRDRLPEVEEWVIRKLK